MLFVEEQAVKILIEMIRFIPHRNPISTALATVIVDSFPIPAMVRSTLPQLSRGHAMAQHDADNPSSLCSYLFSCLQRTVDLLLAPQLEKVAQVSCFHSDLFEVTLLNGCNFPVLGSSSVVLLGAFHACMQDARYEAVWI